MKISATNALKAATILALGANVDAFWRMPCKGRTALARIDPLVNFGDIGDHVHAVHGSSGFSETATYDDLIAGDCTSCEVIQDKSAYWIPALYFKKASGEFQVVQQVGGLLAYYLLEPRNEKLTAFPKGFEMLAGDTYQRNFTWPVPDIEKSLWVNDPAMGSQSFLKQWALGFNCLNYNIAPEPALNRHFFPDKNFLDGKCTQGVRLEIMFPSCWDGKNLAGVNGDKHSHMAYPSLGNTGTCPEGFPVKMPQLFYESIWNTFEFKGQDGQFVFANGDPTGYGFHADFIMGWDESFLQAAVNQCDNPSGRIEDCPLFTLQTEEKSNQCQVKKPSLLNAFSTSAKALNENVEDNLKALPGNVRINAGPAYALGDKAVKPKDPIPTNLVPTLEVSKLPADATKTGYLPGQALKETGGSVYAPAPSNEAKSSSASPASSQVEAAAVKAPEPAPVQAPATTPAPPPPVSSAEVAANSGSFVKTETITKGNDVVHVFYVEELVTVTGTVDVVHVTQTAYVNPMKEKARRRRHVGQHKRAH